MRKRRICIDFDGVIHSYTSGWQDYHIISDPPVNGSFAALSEYCKHYIVCIYSSSRSEMAAGRKAMADWFLQYGWPQDGEGLPKGLEFLSRKPPGWITIDDRCITFTGKFPSIEEIDNFKPWYKKLKEEI
jgi:hypothetical protein